MQTEFVSTGQVLEVACDESGSEGENLIGGNTDVFAHASVVLNVESAIACIQELRNRIRSPAQEYKANHLLRQKHRPALEWLLGSSGPIHGNGHVHLTDKSFFVVGRVVDLLVGNGGQEADADLAVTLNREGPGALGPEQWQAFLEASNNLMRVRSPEGVSTPVDSFYRTLDDVLQASEGEEVRPIIELLGRSRAQADAFRAQVMDSPKMIPVLDPLIPAIVQTINYWSDARRPVSIVHDDHNALTSERIAELKALFGPHPTDAGGRPRGLLTDMRLVDSRSDPRVQVADFLAGVARKIASDELNGRGDAALTALLRPYVDSYSIWGDDRSWSLLGPA